MTSQRIPNRSRNPVWDWHSQVKLVSVNWLIGYMIRQDITVTILYSF